MRHVAFAIALATACAVAAFAVSTSHAATNDTTIVSVDQAGNAPNADSSFPGVSEDGRRIAFGSAATDLTFQAPPDPQIYVWDRSAQETTLASAVSGTLTPANDTTNFAHIDASGENVSFASRAVNLGADGANSQVFVRALSPLTTTIASAENGTLVRGNGVTTAHDISANGRYVVFRTGSTNLPGGVSGQTYRRDLVTNQTLLVSARDETTTPGNAATGLPSVSADGRFVSFSSTATDLVPGVIGGIEQLYVRDMQTNRTFLASAVDGAGTPGDGASTDGELSGDGRYITFDSNATNLVEPDPPAGQIYRRDLVSQTTELASAVSGSSTAGNGVADMPDLSPDGQFVAFQSSATNLIPGSPTTGAQVFLRNMANDRTVLVSAVDGTSTPGDAGSDFPDVAAGGRFVAFGSQATNLVGGTVNVDAIYLREVGAAPVNETPPQLSGKAFVGETLTCSPGSWANEPEPFSFAWFRDGVQVATGSDYVVTEADVGQSLACRVTGGNFFGNSTARSSAVVPQQSSTGPAGPAGPAGEAEERLVVTALPRYRARRVGQRVRLRYALTTPASVVLDVRRRGKRRVAQVVGEGEAGRNTIVWNGRIRRGDRRRPAPRGIYVLRLTAKGDDQVDSDTVTVRLRPRAG